MQTTNHRGNEIVIFNDFRSWKIYSIIFSQCIPIPGLGFRRGSYKCVCRKGFYYPETKLEHKYFNGSILEEEYAKLMQVNFRFEIQNEQLDTELRIHFLLKKPPLSISIQRCPPWIWSCWDNLRFLILNFKSNWFRTPV